MADELELHFVVEGQPQQAAFSWRSQPPEALANFELVDESYNSLTYEQRYYDWPSKLLYITIVGYFLRSLMQSQWKLTVRFDPEGEWRSRATIVGKADPETRAALGQLADQHGGPSGLRVGA